MAITDITISQDNIVNGSNLLPVHSTLAFIADVTYTGATPDVLKVEIRDTSDTVLDTWQAIPYRDLLTTVREFAFIADEPIRSLMESFDDTFQLDSTLQHIEEITHQYKIRFYDPDDPNTYAEVLIDAIHGASQFGSNPNLDTIFNNDEDTYYAGKDDIVYVYFYNDDENNTVSVNQEVLIEDTALDYDDVEFTDSDDTEFTILTL